MPASRSSREVPVIDLFAGPGGLGEGFSALLHDRIRFDLRLSVEKDVAAHKTLTLRSFFRQLSSLGRRDYYEYLRGCGSREKLFAAHPEEAARATAACLLLELGPRTASRVYSHIERLLGHTQHWVLVGGPPCQAYSVVGRSRLARIGREAFEKSEKHVLYREYLRILARYRPPVFVIENVKGLLSATYGGSSTFERMINDLSSPSAAVRESVNGSGALTRRGSEYSILSLGDSKVGTEKLSPEDYIIAAE